MDVLIVPTINLLRGLLGFYLWIIFGRIVLSWLFVFNVVNPYSPFVKMLNDTFYRLTEPLQERIRNFLPDTGALDLSPVVLIFGVYFVQNVLERLLLKLL